MKEHHATLLKFAFQHPKTALGLVLLLVAVAAAGNQSWGICSIAAIAFVLIVIVGIATRSKKPQAKETAARPTRVPLKPLEDIDNDLERGWELGKRWALMRDELCSKFEAESIVSYQQLVDFDRLIEDLTPLLEEYGSVYEKRLNWDYKAEEGTLLEQVKNSWSLILLSTVLCKKCGKVVTSESEGVNTKYGKGIMQDGATAVLNKGLCKSCNESKAQSASVGK